MKFKNILMMSLMSIKLMGMDIEEDLTFVYQKIPGYPNTTARLSQFTPENINNPDGQGMAIIHYAATLAKPSDSEFFKGIIAKGANIELKTQSNDMNLRTKRGELVSILSPIYMAVTAGAFHNVRLLVEAGAHFGSIRKKGDPFLYLDNRIALKSGLTVLHAIFADWFAHKRVPVADYIDITNFLLDTGAIDINTPGLLGQTLLHIACEKGQLDFIKLLIERGADKGALDYESWTPLRAAQDSLESYRISRTTYDQIEDLLDPEARQERILQAKKKAEQEKLTEEEKKKKIIEEKEARKAEKDARKKEEKKAKKALDDKKRTRQLLQNRIAFENKVRKNEARKAEMEAEAARLREEMDKKLPAEAPVDMEIDTSFTVTTDELPLVLDSSIKTKEGTGTVESVSSTPDELQVKVQGLGWNMWTSPLLFPTAS